MFLFSIVGNFMKKLELLDLLATGRRCPLELGGLLQRSQRVTWIQIVLKFLWLKRPLSSQEDASNLRYLYYANELSLTSVG